MDGSEAESSTAETAPGASASSPRYFWVGMAVFLILIVFLGFGSTYGRQLVMGQEISGAGVVETDWVIHLHTAVFLVWMALLLAQTVLIARGRPQAHMSLGWYAGVPWGVALLLVGALITCVQIQAAVSKGVVPAGAWGQMLSLSLISWLDLLAFGLLGSLGLVYRRRPSVHKRFMTFATAAVAMAGVARMEYLLGPWDTYIGVGLVTATLVGYDLYTEDRVHGATLLGACVLGLVQVLADLFG